MVKKALSTAVAVGSAMVGFTGVAFASGTAATISVDAKSAGFQISDLGTLINSLLNIALGVVGFLVFIYLIWGGVEWITAGGDKSKTESARQKITNAIIGLAIVAAAFAISKVLGAFFGVEIGTEINIPKPY